MLFVNPTYVSRLDGMSEAESQLVLAAVQNHAAGPEFCCRFRRCPGAVAIWDNLATQHYAIDDYRGHRRLMYRTAFLGPRLRDLAAAPQRVSRSTSSASSHSAAEISTG